MLSQNTRDNAYFETVVIFKTDQELAQEHERLHRERRLLREERALLENATLFFAGQNHEDQD
jgi:transposase-like protein